MSEPNCRDVAPLLLDAARGRLAGDAAARVEQHLAGCEACRKQFERERQLDAALGTLPRHPLPARLRAKLTRRAKGERFFPKWEAVAAVLLVGMALGGGLAKLAFLVPSGAAGGLASEAVNDHLRQLYREHPLEVASSDSHQVKPWFAGRLDFAPIVHFEGDPEFPLLGGAVGYFVDRKAAVFSYSRRLHNISLLVFRAEGLPLTAEPLPAESRGFHALLWREGDLGYALVSDVNPDDLRQLANRLRAP